MPCGVGNFASYRRHTVSGSQASVRGRRVVSYGRHSVSWILPGIDAIRFRKLKHLLCEPKCVHTTLRFDVDKNRRETETGWRASCHTTTRGRQCRRVGRTGWRACDSTPERHLDFATLRSWRHRNILPYVPNPVRATRRFCRRRDVVSYARHIVPSTQRCANRIPCNTALRLDVDRIVAYVYLRNINQGQCWYSKLVFHSQSRRGRHVDYTACCTCSPGVRTCGKFSRHGCLAATGPRVSTLPSIYSLFHWKREAEEKPSTNVWFTGLKYSARTLHSHDLEESWWKSPTPPSTCCIWLDIWRRFKSLLFCSMFESTSSWGSTAPDKVWMQKWMWRKVQLSQKPYSMYRILSMLGFHLQQQNKPARDEWRERRLMSTSKTTSIYHVTFAFFSFIKWLNNN